MDSLRERKKQATRSAILRRARELFLERGYDETAMDVIAAAANVSRTTLFNYFPNKSALLVAMAERREQQFYQIVDEACRQTADTARRVERIFRRWADYLLDSPKLHSLITAALTSGARSDSANSAALGGYMAAFRRLIDEGLARGDVRGDFSPEAMTQLLVSALLTGSYTLFHGEDRNVEHHFMENARFVAQAITTRS